METTVIFNDHIKEKDIIVFNDVSTFNLKEGDEVQLKIEVEKDIWDVESKDIVGRVHTIETCFKRNYGSRKVDVQIITVYLDIIDY